VKIVQAIGWYFPDSVGGTEVYVAEMCRRLRASGHTVVIAVPSPGSAVERKDVYDGVPVYRYPIPRQPTRDEAQGRSVTRGAERFHAWLHEQRPDVVHFHTFVTGLGLAEVQAAKAAGARVIVTTHSSSLGYICQRGTLMRWGESLCDGICRPHKCAACELQHRGLPRPLAQLVGSTPPIVGRYLRALPGRLGTVLAMNELIAHNQAQQRTLVATVDKLVLLTQWALDAVAANGAPRAKLALNRLGCAAPGQRKPGPQQQPTRVPIRVGYVGRFDAIKGVHDLARAAAALPADVAVRIEFRGPIRSEPEHTVVEDLKRIVAGDLRVTFASAVAPAEVAAVLSGYDVLCCPSVCLEGGPTVAIEAHAAGTPVIGTRIGGLAELVTDGANGRLVAPGDWRALSALLREMAADPHGTIDRWRSALPPARVMDEIVADYLRLYTMSSTGADA
jgi:glycosyltransferase involved in cell wall biosynthesis